MKTEHLGDAYDFVKKDILRTLKMGLNRKVYVLPMFTDTFEGENLQFYRNLTSCDEIIELNQLQSNQNSLSPNEIIFADPDTGIHQESSEKHISFDQLTTISGQCHLLVVYDQSFDRNEETAGTKRNQIQGKLSALSGRGLHAFYLNLNGSLTFAFISRKKEVLDRARCLLTYQVALPSRLIPQENSSQVEPPQQGLGK